jgi:hypothetical protein
MGVERLLQEPDRALQLQMEEDQCYCPVGAKIQGPTAEELLVAFNANVDAVGDSQFPFLKQALDIKMVQAVNCTGVVSTFLSFLSQGFSGDPELLTEEGEQIMLDVYNKLNEKDGHCKRDQIPKQIAFKHPFG